MKWNPVALRTEREPCMCSRGWRSRVLYFLRPPPLPTTTTRGWGGENIWGFRTVGNWRLWPNLCPGSGWRLNTGSPSPPPPGPFARVIYGAVCLISAEERGKTVRVFLQAICKKSPRRNYEPDSYVACNWGGGEQRRRLERMCCGNLRKVTKLKTP